MKKIHKNLTYFLIVTILLVFTSCTGNKTTENNEATEVEEGTEELEAEVAKDIKSEEISYEADGLTMNGFIAYDANQSGPRPGILVVHEWWGHNDYARERASQLAEMGYVALAVDMYGDGKQADHPEDAGKFAGQVFSNIDGAMARLSKAMEVIKNNKATDSTKIAAIGYCFGGGVVLHAARFGLPLKGVVSFHGSLGTETPAQADQVSSKVLVCHGADDEFVAPETIDVFKKEMEDAGVDYIFKSYEGAVHSFTNPGSTAIGEKFGMNLAYNESADKASWAEMTAFFETIFQ